MAVTLDKRSIKALIDFCQPAGTKYSLCFDPKSLSLYSTFEQFSQIKSVYSSKSSMPSGLFMKCLLNNSVVVGFTGFIALLIAL